MTLLLAASSIAYVLLLVCAGLFVFALLLRIRTGEMPLLEWMTPRERAMRKASRQLRDGDWQEAFAAAGKLRDPKTPDPEFDQRLTHFEGECLYRGAERSLQLGRYAEALELMRGAGDRLGLPEAEFDKRIVGLLLAEIRRRITTDPAGDEVGRLARETFRLAGADPEASFWLGFHELHRQKAEPAREALMAAAADLQVPDGALYLGALLSALNEPADARQWLVQGLQNAPDCPMLQWQYADSLLNSGGDPAVAVKFLEKATGPEGFSKYHKSSNLIWQTLGTNSWITALVRRTPIRCPLGFDRPEFGLAASRRLLAQALEKCDRGADAATIYYQSFSAGDDSLAVRKGLGMSLARAGLYDDAMPHLQAARTQEQPPSPLTVGYLALCTARSRAPTPSERAKHIREALALLGSLQVRGDVEWARLARDLVHEAKDADVALSPEQKAELACIFASVEARDSVALESYDQLAGAAVEIPIEVAALFVRSATETGVRSPHELALFDRAFRDRDGLRRLFVGKKWDIGVAERIYLERWAESRPGRYPDAPGALYAALAERTLLDESRRHLNDGRLDAARAAIDLAARLGPTRALTLDRLAELAEQVGDRAECLRHLDTWAEKHPNDPRALTRRALLDFRDGKIDEALDRLTDACAKAIGPQRAKILCVTARVALAAKQAEVAAELFEQARLLVPTDPEPLIGIAALAWQRGDSDKLAALAPLFDRARNTDPFRALLASLSFALAGDDERSEAEYEVAVANPALAAEAGYLRAVLLAWRNRNDEACAMLDTGAVQVGATRDHVFGLRGQLAWKAGDYAGAVAAWSELSPERRAAWKLDTLFPAATFLGGAARLAAGNAVAAAELFRQARDAGFVHDRLPALEAAARQRGTQQSAIAGDAAALQPLRDLELAVRSGGTLSANLAAWLARGYRRQGDLPAARRALDNVQEPNAHVWLQLGLLAVADQDLAAAETAFVAALNRAPDSPAVAYNLAFARLSLGKLNNAHRDLARAAELHPNAEAKLVLSQLAALAPGGDAMTAVAGLTSADEQRVVKLLQQIGRLDAAAPMIENLAAARPTSNAGKLALAEVQILLVRSLIDRGDPDVALSVGGSWPQQPTRALNNLLGVAAALSGNLLKALEFFQAALPAAGDDARVQQNIALTASHYGDQSRARLHWQKYLSSLPAHCPAPPGDSDYLYRLGELVRTRLTEALAEAAT